MPQSLLLRLPPAGQEETEWLTLDQLGAPTPTRQSVEVVFAVDHAQAAQLAADAADATYEDWFPTESALRDITAILAISDPGRVRQLIRMTSYDHERARLLAAAAKAVSAIDPERAEQYAADAERLAESYTDDDRFRARILTQVAGILAGQ